MMTKQGKMKKYKVLFAFHTFTEEEKVLAENYVRMTYIGPLGETDCGEYEIFFYGQWLTSDTFEMNWMMIQKCLEYEPDVLMIMNGWYRDCHPKSSSFPRLTTIYALRNMLNIRVASLWMDIAYQGFRMVDPLAAICDTTFTFEHPERYLHHSQYPCCYFHTSPTFSAKLLRKDPAKERCVDIAHIGQLQGFGGDRERGIRALEQAGIDVSLPGGQGKGQNRVSNEDLAALYGDTKIVINFSKHISGKWFQAKGRVFEAALAGAMVLCEECDAINYWLEPNLEVAVFKDEGELVQKAKYFLENEAERLKVAAAGHKAMLGKLSSQAVWENRFRVLFHNSQYDQKRADAIMARHCSDGEIEVLQYIHGQMLDAEKRKFTGDFLNRMRQYRSTYSYALDSDGWRLYRLFHVLTSVKIVLHKMLSMCMLPLRLFKKVTKESQNKIAGY